ncbi:MAG: hypothetical protein IPP49_07155 [Saprospiraceae bacterium]|nr:hypothetical protein [Saprospiraceae bacterium]
MPRYYQQVILPTVASKMSNHKVAWRNTTDGCHNFRYIPFIDTVASEPGKALPTPVCGCTSDTALGAETSKTDQDHCYQYGNCGAIDFMNKRCAQQLCKYEPDLLYTFDD